MDKRRHQRNELCIPLCLYFNKKFQSRHECCVRLYIPLCLYFNLYRKRWQESVYRLYIPLCLYFNQAADQMAEAAINFTFHYVSILIFWFPGAFGDGKTFTFHYASILILAWSATFAALSYFTFHYVSILIDFGKYKGLPIYLYIPLCLYFNSAFSSVTDSMRQLYIPLCLYFNHLPDISAQAHFHPLHSIMSLF